MPADPYVGLLEPVLETFDVRLKQMFGGFAYYVDDRLVWLNTARRKPWDGVLVPTDSLQRYLAEIRRNSGLIVETCAKIREEEPFEFPDKLDLEAGQNLMLRRSPNAGHLSRALRAPRGPAPRRWPATLRALPLEYHKTGRRLRP